MIKIKDLYKSFNGEQTFVVNDVTLEIHDNETLIILGSSGSGKSTLLKMINRLIEPTSGIIEIDGQNINNLNPVQLRRSIGYVFQQIGLFPHLTVEENIIIILRLKERPRDEQSQRAKELLELVDLNPSDFAHRLPHELSGGQQQRVGVARALAGNPRLLLMDEPFGALDAISRDALQQALLHLKQRLKKTIIFVTHDIFEALRLGDRIAIMNNGQIEQIGKKKEILDYPATPFVSELFEKVRHQLKDFASLINE